jgi:oligoribonuclease (3'-5' exoribonuclease)
MRDKIINVLKQHFESHVHKHKMNVDIMLDNPMAIHEHTDLMSAIEKEVEMIAEYQDKLEVIEKYFKAAE